MSSKKSKAQNNYTGPTYVDRERDEIEELDKQIAASTPASGTLFTTSEQKRFSEFPISKLTLKGLARGKFETTTEIQRQAIPHALAGRDILGAAKTGSGKTLAYLIPLVEDLFRAQWSRADGLGALIISPTRELALQIYEVARVLLYSHAFHAGLLLGGTDFIQEQKQVMKMQLAVCTPGRALQHLEQTPGFDIGSTLRVLVLDEADRLLDMGFRDQLEAIVSYCPRPRSEKNGLRQTMLFSATQTKSVKDLARLSLRSPEFISVHEKESEATPAGLRQLYVCAALGDKLDVIFSFIKSHLKAKTIVFFSSCKQVKFMDVAFRRMRPGVPIMALHGKQSPSKRTGIYESFVSRPAACLFATDVAARGLDFPNVDWVVQADCPEDAAAYIHRVGRTARYNRNGNALLVLLPSEEKPFLKLLETHKVPIKRLGVNPMRRQSIQEKLRGLLIADTELKLAAQKAFKAYLRSVHLQTNREVFDVKKLAFKEFAQSLGLSAAPRIKFSGKGGEKGRQQNREVKNKNYLLEADDLGLGEMEKGSRKMISREDNEDDSFSSSSSGEEDNESIEEAEEEKQSKQKKKSKWERVMNKKPMASRVQNEEDDDESDGDDELLVRKSSSNPKPSEDNRSDRTKANASDDAPSSNSITALVRQKQRKLKPIKFGDDLEVKSFKMRPQVAEFDDDGDAIVDPFESMPADDVQDKSMTKQRNNQRAEYLKRLSEKLKEEDVVDREMNRKRVKEMHREKKQKLKGRRHEEDEDDRDDGVVVTLGRSGSDEDGTSNDRYSDGAEDDDEDVERKAMRLIEEGL